VSDQLHWLVTFETSEGVKLWEGVLPVHYWSLATLIGELMNQPAPLKLPFTIKVEEAQCD